MRTLRFIPRLGEVMSYGTQIYNDKGAKQAYKRYILRAYLDRLAERRKGRRTEN